jgi:hypothetical protein
MLQSIVIGDAQLVMVRVDEVQFVGEHGVEASCRSHLTVISAIDLRLMLKGCRAST